MRKLLDEDGSELAGILEALLRENVNVTAREVARRHSVLKNPSAFTRNPARMSVIKLAQQRQQDARNAGSDRPVQGSGLQAQLDARNERVRELEAQVRSLVASHAACVRAVMLHGGTAALERFWTDYKSIADTIVGLEAMPPSADIVPLREPNK